MTVELLGEDTREEGFTCIYMCDAIKTISCM